MIRLSLLILPLTLCCAAVAVARDVRTFVSDASFDAYAEHYVTNLPTTLSVANGVLRLRQGSTNLWTSSEAHDWGSWLPTGVYNPGAGEAVALNLPLTLQPVGTEWAAAGAYAVLALSPGASMTAIGSEASVTWTYPDGSTWRWVAETIVDVPAVAQGITLGEDATGAEAVLIDYAATPDAAELTLLRADTYAGAYASVTHATWAQVSDTLRRATVPTGGASAGFFRARVADAVPAHIECSAPLYLPAGVMVSSGDINPVVFDTVITVTGSDGALYRIPAQSLE